MTNAVSIAAVLMTASWERQFDAGKITKYGERFDPAAMTCAAYGWPHNAILRVTEIHCGASVIVRVIDTPAKGFTNRIDLSPAAFARLAAPAAGLVEVRVQEYLHIP